MLKQKIIIAVVKEDDPSKSKAVTVGYRFLDLETKETDTFHVKDKSFLSFLIKNRNNIVNGTWDSGKMRSIPQIKFINGNESRYPVIDAKTGNLVGANPLVIAAEFKDGYLVVGPFGEMYEWTKKQAVAYARLNGIANGKYSSNGSKDFISAITGSYPMIDRKVVTPEMIARKKAKVGKEAKEVQKKEVKKQDVKVKQPVVKDKKVDNVIKTNNSENITFNLFDRGRKIAALNKTVEELYDIAVPNSYNEMFVTIKSLKRFMKLSVADMYDLRIIESGKEGLYLLNRIEYDLKKSGVIITYNLEVFDGKEPVNCNIVLIPKGEDEVKLTEREFSERLHSYCDSVIKYLRDVQSTLGKTFDDTIIKEGSADEVKDITEKIMEDTSGYTTEELEADKGESKQKFSDDFYIQLEPTFGGHNSVEILKYMIEERDYSIDAVYKLIEEGKEVNKYVPTLIGLITRNADAVHNVFDKKLEKLCEKAIEPEVLRIERDLITAEIDFDEVWDSNVIVPKREHDTKKWAFPLSLMEEKLANYIATTGEDFYGCQIEKDGTVIYNGQKLDVPGYRISGVNPGYITVTSISDGKTVKVKSK